MSSEEKKQWKEKEEEIGKQKEEKMEELDKLVDILLAKEPYNDQIVINEGNEELEVSSEIKKENESLSITNEEKPKNQHNFNNENQENLIESKQTEEKTKTILSEKNVHTTKEEDEKRELIEPEGIKEKTDILEREELAEGTNSSPKERQNIELNVPEAHTDLAISYNKDGERILQSLDKKLFNQLIKNQDQPTFRLEWQRDWFTGFEKNKSELNQRKLFLLDFTKNESLGLPSDMKRVWVIKNEPKWNYLAHTKRELHGNSIKGLMSTLFGKRNKVSDFDRVGRYSYEKAMKKIWNEFQTTFASEIKLKAKNRPATKALKANYSKESVDSAMIGSLWYYYYGLKRKGRSDLEKGGYKSLAEFLKNDAPRIIPFVIDRNNQINKNLRIKIQTKDNYNRGERRQQTQWKKFRKEDYESKLDLSSTLEKIHLEKKYFNTKSSESQQKFVKAWNMFVESKNNPSINMWRIYNEIQRQSSSPLLYVYSGDDRPRLRLKKDFKKAEILHKRTLEKISTFKNTTLITEWLKFRQRIEGKSALNEIKIINPMNGKEEIWFIRNTKNYWNPEGLPFKNDTAEKRFVSSEFFEEWKFLTRDRSVNFKMGEIKGYLPLSIKKSILDNLFSENSIPNGAVFTQAYKLRMNVEKIDQYFEWLWYKEKKSIKQIDETRPILKSLNDYYKDIKIEDKIINVDIKEKFDIYLYDKSHLFHRLFSDLQNIVDYRHMECRNLEEWWELVRSNITVEELAKSLLRATYTEHIYKIPIYYRFYQGTTSRFGPLFTNPTRFWNESNNNGFSGMAAEIMENDEIRQIIETSANKERKLGPLTLRKGIKTEMTGHRTTSSDRLITVPDGFTGSDVFQNKLLRPIGYNRDEINSLDYLLDWLKTVGNYDPINYSINNLQLEFIPWGSLNNLTNIAVDQNAIIISYWGKTAVEIGRFMEVISAIHLHNFKQGKKQNLTEEELRRLIIDDLNRRTYLDIKIDKIDLATMNIIDQFLPEGVWATGESTFLKNSLIDLLKIYGESLFHDYYPSFSKE